jgi:hypothetical protein
MELRDKLSTFKSMLMCCPEVSAINTQIYVAHINSGINDTIKNAKDRKERNNF